MVKVDKGVAWSGQRVCPYQGLAPFEIETSEFFFGRARATSGLLDRLGPRLAGQGSILLVSGASGVGKSSLLRAGLMPALAAGTLQGAQHWKRLISTPTASPISALAHAWARTHGGDPEELGERLRHDPQHALPGRPLLVVDQFEELFTLVADEQERQAFVRILHALATGPAKAGVILGLRADYWDRCAAYPQFAEAIQDGQVIVEPMTESDMRLAITGPAAKDGLELEPGLVETVLADLREGRAAGDRYEAGDLSLLSQALHNTWERREDGRLTIRGYEASGRVHDSVRRTADTVLEALPRAERTTALKIFRRLTLITAGGRVARRSATLAELHAAASARTPPERAQIEAMLSAFADRRMLTLHEDRVEIAHDALLTAWPTLKQWIEPDLLAQQAYDRLVEDAAQWADNYRDAAFLYRGNRLLTVNDSRPRWDRDPDSFPPPGPTVTQFLAASTHEARRAGRRRRLVTAGLAALSVLALVAAGAAVNAADEAHQQRSLASSRQLAAQSEITDDPATSARLAIAAWRIAPTAEARHQLLVTAARRGQGSLTGHDKYVKSMEFSRDGKILITAGSDGVRIWSTASRQQLGAPIKPQERCGPSDIRLALSPDARMLAVSCTTQVEFWDVSARQPAGGVLKGNGALTDIAFSPHGRILAIAAQDGTIALWDVAARNRLHVLGRPGENGAEIVEFSPDGRRLAAGYVNGDVRFWDPAAGRQSGALRKGHSQYIEDIAFSRDGSTLATASTDGPSRLWEVATHRKLGDRLYPAGRRFTVRHVGVAFSPDGSKLATVGGGALNLWDTATHRQLGGVRDESHTLAAVKFSPDGKLLAASGDDGVVRLLNPLTHQQIGATMPGLYRVALSPDGRTLATGQPSTPDRPSRLRSTVQLLDATTQRTLGPPLGDAESRKGLHTIQYARDSRTLVTASGDGVRIFDTVTRRQLGPTYVTSRSAGGTATADGRLLALIQDESLLLWDVTQRRESGPRIPVPGLLEPLTTLELSPDGTTLAAVGFDDRVRIYDVRTRRQVGAALPVPVNSGLLKALAFSPDGKTLAYSAYDSATQLWDVVRQRTIGTGLPSESGEITGIAFSPDGKVLVTGSVEGFLQTWSLSAYDAITTPFYGHDDAVTDIAFGRDGATIATVGDDETARLWNIALPTDPVAAACAVAGRSFTPAEWERYVPQEKFRRICR